MDLNLDLSSLLQSNETHSIVHLVSSHCKRNNTENVDFSSPAVVARNVIIGLLDLIGLFGNLLSCVVIKRFLLKTSGTYVLFVFLALADSLVMVVMTIEIFRPTFPDQLMPTSTPGCAFHSFFFHFSFELSAWIILALTVERYLTIRAPFAHRERSKIIRRAWCIGGSIVFVLFLINGHNFFTRVARDESVTFLCMHQSVMTCHYRFNDTNIVHMVGMLSNYVHAFAYAFIPYLITFVFNVILLIRLFMTRNYQQNRRTTVMLLLVTFSFIVLTLPHAIFSIKINYMNKAILRNTRIVFRDIGRVLVLVNHALNFAFYMTGRQFRAAVHRLFGGYWDRRRRSSIRSISRRLYSAPIVMTSIKGHCHNQANLNNNNSTRCSELDQFGQMTREYAGKMYTPCNHHDFPATNRNRHCSNNSCL